MGAAEEPLAASRVSVEAGSDLPNQIARQLEEAAIDGASESLLQHRYGLP